MPQWKCNVGFVMFVFFIYFSLFEDFNMQRHDDLLRDSESIDGQEFSQQPPLSSWCQRQIEVQQCWQQARPQNIVNLFSAENIVQMTCKHCHVREAIIKSKSNQITFIVTSPQHKCLGEWNSYERAPDSAKNKTKQKTTIYIWTVHIYRLYRRQCAKYTYIYSVHSVL